MQLFRFTRLLIPTLAIVLHAQDAGMVLRTSVGYRTLRNSAQLTEEQKKEADQLSNDAQQSNTAGKYGDAMRSLYHGMAVMRGVAWSPALEFASGLQGRLDHAVVDPGKQITITLSPLYATSGTVKMNAAVFLVSRKEGVAEKSMVSAPIDPSHVPFSTKVVLPADAAGDYALEVRLAAEGDAAPSGPARNGMVKSMPVHVEALSAPAQGLRDHLAKMKSKKSPALPTAEYALALYERADHGEANPAAYHFADEFARANEILDSIDAGRDPFANKRGDFRKAYLSGVDQTLQPYRLFIPEAYSSSKPNALVVALHGMGGDENSMFDAYGAGALKREAERLGLMVVCPKGRDTASMYRGSAEQDVMDVLAEVRRDYKIDPTRIFLMGHSMGGYGTWSVAMSYPDVFAALGPISGGGNPVGMSKIKSIPEYVVHGDNDPTVPVTMSRMMVEAGKVAGASITYVEVPGGNHMNVVVPQFKPMLEFFAKQQRVTSTQ